MNVRKLLIKNIPLNRIFFILGIFCLYAIGTLGVFYSSCTFVFFPLLLVFLLFVSLQGSKSFIFNIITATLLQNLLLGVFTNIWCLLSGKCDLEPSPLAQIVIMFLLEIKLIILLIEALKRFLISFITSVQERKVPIFDLLWGLLLVMVVFNGISSLSSGFLSVISSLRSYVSLLLVFYVAVKYPFRFTGIGMLPLIWVLTLFFWVCFFLFNVDYALLDSVIGIRFIYLYKYLFVARPELGVIIGVFRTYFLHAIFIRSGGIFFEPVNYSYFIAFAMMYVLAIGKRYWFRVILLFILGFSLFLNMGKAGILFFIIVVFLYFFVKLSVVFKHLIRKMYFVFLVGVVWITTVIAPLLSRSTMGHFIPMLKFWATLKANWKSFLFPIGNMGLAGNLSKQEILVNESAIAVSVAEMGIIWLIVLVVFFLFTYRHVYRRGMQSNKLVFVYFTVACFSYLLLGFFQENVFSVQVTLFTILIPFLLFRNKFVLRET